MTHGSIFNVEKWPKGQFSTGLIFFITLDITHGMSMLHVIITNTATENSKFSNVMLNGSNFVAKTVNDY